MNKQIIPVKSVALNGEGTSENNVKISLQNILKCRKQYIMRQLQSNLNLDAYLRRQVLVKAEIKKKCNLFSDLGYKYF